MWGVGGLGVCWWATTTHAPDPHPAALTGAGACGAAVQGAFAEAQARYLAPDAAAVSQLVRVCRDKHIGVVAHFYMDPQVQVSRRGGRRRRTRGGWGSGCLHHSQ